MEFKKVSSDLNIFELKENEQRTFKLETAFVEITGKTGTIVLHEVTDTETGEQGHIFSPHIITALVQRAEIEKNRTDGATEIYLQITFTGKVKNGKKTLNTFECAYCVQ